MPQSSHATKKFRPGQALFQEGEMPRSAYLVVKGTISVRKMKGAQHVELARIYSNELIGELSFFDRQPRSASAFALTEVEVTEIPYSTLETLFQTTPSYLKSMIKAMAERLRKANEAIKRLQKNPTTDTGSPIGSPAEDEGLDAAAALALTSMDTVLGTSKPPEPETKS